MTSEAQKRAHAELRKRRIAAGLAPLTVWLSKAAMARVAELAKVRGSNAAGLEFLLAPKPEDFENTSQAEAIRRHIAPRGEQDRLMKQAHRVVEVPVELVEELASEYRRVMCGPVDALTGEPLPKRKPMQKGQGKKR